MHNKVHNLSLNVIDFALSSLVSLSAGNHGLRRQESDGFSVVILKRVNNSCWREEFVAKERRNT